MSGSDAVAPGPCAHSDTGNGMTADVAARRAAWTTFSSPRSSSGSSARMAVSTGLDTWCCDSRGLVRADAGGADWALAEPCATVPLVSGEAGPAATTAAARSGSSMAAPTTAAVAGGMGGDIATGAVPLLAAVAGGAAAAGDAGSTDTLRCTAMPAAGAALAAGIVTGTAAVGARALPAVPAGLCWATLTRAEGTCPAGAACAAPIAIPAPAWYDGAAARAAIAAYTAAS